MLLALAALKRFRRNFGPMLLFPIPTIGVSRASQTVCPPKISGDCSASSVKKPASVGHGGFSIDRAGNVAICKLGVMHWQTLPMQCVLKLSQLVATDKNLSKHTTRLVFAITALPRRTLSPL
jgi:hypothetical protein